MNGQVKIQQKLEYVQNVKALILTEKKCTKCQNTKIFECFGFDKRAKDGRQSRCRGCVAVDKALNYKNNPEKYRSAHKKRYDKNPEKFRERARIYSIEHAEQYRETQRKSNKKWYIKNKEKIKKKSIEWKNLNRERCRENNRKWNRANPERTKERNRKSKEKLYGTPGGKLSHSISSSVYKSVSGNKKGRGWESLVGYTVEKLKKHLEKLFKPGMTWENYGQKGWHVDHIIPVSVFNFEKPEDDDFKRCWSLKNLQPLWAKENISKNNSIKKPFQPNLIFK